MTDPVILTIHDNIATLTLNRPDQLNTMRAADYDFLIQCLDEADTAEHVRAVILTGTGRAFSAGTDLSEGFDLPSGGDPVTGELVPPDLGGRVSLRIFEMRKPVIAAINGAAMGFGASLTLPCDFRIGSRKSKFGFVFAARGISPDGCSSWFLPRIVGLPTALDWLLTARTIDAEEALRSGLLTNLVEEEELQATAFTLAHSIAKNCAPQALAFTRQLTWRMSATDTPQTAHELESRALVATLSGPNPDEGAAAFLKKRPAQYGSYDSRGQCMNSWWNKN